MMIFLQGDTLVLGVPQSLQIYRRIEFQGENLKIAFGGWDGAGFKFSSERCSYYKTFRIELKTIDNSTPV